MLGGVRSIPIRSWVLHEFHNRGSGERWRPRGEQGFDPLAIIDDGADAPPAGTQLVVLTNNAYSAKVKRLGREDFLASGGDLARWIALALGDG